MVYHALGKGDIVSEGIGKVLVTDAGHAKVEQPDSGVGDEAAVGCQLNCVDAGNGGAQ